MRVSRHPVRGALIYVSRDKLAAQARDLTISTPHDKAAVTGTGTASVSLAGLAEIGGEIQAQRATAPPEDAARQREERLLDDVVRKLIERGLPNLEEGDALAEGQPFTFHRDLRFGVGTDDDTNSVHDLVLVDREPVPLDGVRPGLLMTGSPRHLRPPYFDPALSDAIGARSGSGSGRLFTWLHDVHVARDAGEDDRAAALAGERFSPLEWARLADPATSMYHLFARDDWMRSPRFPQLNNPAPCAGVAIASYIAMSGEGAVVFASPLYVAVQPIARGELTPRAPRRRLLRRARAAEI